MTLFTNHKVCLFLLQKHFFRGRSGQTRMVVYYGFGSLFSMSMFLLGNIVYGFYNEQHRRNMESTLSKGLPHSKKIFEFVYGKIKDK